MRKFWNWSDSAEKGAARTYHKTDVKNESGGRTLYFDGAISSETWWGDEITPAIFKEELNASTDDLTIWINSPGGDVHAGAQIYNMLKEYPGKITVKIDGLAASIASVIAMAGNKVLMSPVSTLVIHNPETIAIGDEAEMRRARDKLAEIKESIVNAYELKTGLSRTMISHLMSVESWMNVKTAMDLGFADGMLYSDDNAPDGELPVYNSMLFSRQNAANSLLKKLSHKAADNEKTTPESKPKSAENEPTPPENKPDNTVDNPVGVPVTSLYKRLFLLI